MPRFFVVRERPSSADFKQQERLGRLVRLAPLGASRFMLVLCGLSFTLAASGCGKDQRRPDPASDDGARSKEDPGDGDAGGDGDSGDNDSGDGDSGDGDPGDGDSGDGDSGDGDPGDGDAGGDGDGDEEDNGWFHSASLTPTQLSELLPKDEEGRATLWKVGETNIILEQDAPEPGPNTANTACLDLKSSCLIATGGLLEECILALPKCETDEPWDEKSACCPASCIEAYQEQRELGAKPQEASFAVFGSTHECFPGLQEWYQKRGGHPYLAPRRTK